MAADGRVYCVPLFGLHGAGLARLDGLVLMELGLESVGLGVFGVVNVSN